MERGSNYMNGYLKQTPNQKRKLTRKCTECSNTSFCRFCVLIVPSIVMQQKYVLLQTGAPKDAAMLGHSLPVKSKKKRLAYEVTRLCNTSHTCSRHRRSSLTDTRRECSGPCFCNVKTLIFHTLNHKLTEKLL